MKGVIYETRKTQLVMVASFFVLLCRGLPLEADGGAEVVEVFITISIVLIL